MRAVDLRAQAPLSTGHAGKKAGLGVTDCWLLSRQCRADPHAALRVARSGAVDAAVAVLNSTGGAEALGLLWTLRCPPHVASAESVIDTNASEPAAPCIRVLLALPFLTSLVALCR